MSVTTIEILAAILFALALVHTFSTRVFERLAHRYPSHSGLFHLLGEVEVVFGLWAMVLFAAMLVLQGKAAATDYISSRNFVEPLFVFAIMVIAASKPITDLAATLVTGFARLLPVPANPGLFVLCMGLLPLLGSFITEPAAMTVAALMLRDRFLSAGISERFKYGIVGVLFVNISIGGVLTAYAAPPVLMVVGAWGWDSAYMLTHFGWKAALAVVINSVALTFVFRRELLALPAVSAEARAQAAPWHITAIHLAFLAGVVYFGHYPAVCMGLLMAFIGFAHAYERHQNRLMIKEALLVAFFLSGLVTLGGLQEWWLRPLLVSMSQDAVFFGATALTAITDNAALTYLGSLVEGLPEGFKYMLVAGAVAGGGLTVIANAPNPAGISILRGHFADETVSAGPMLLAALPPTVVAMAALWLL
ncbi:MAG: putative Na+/H+ antiporter [Candidatus Dactylopiibacterium sp.]|nr:putative Na+/H+ antiporter [Candidatus Dactylopiibacterium sp.]